MIDLHTHTLFSDGVLLPSELVYRAKVKGYEVLAITDHGDFSTFDFVIPRLKKVCRTLSVQYKITVIPGIEITYVHPKQISKAVKLCKKLGAKLIVVHGETPAETVPPDTNRSAIMAGADILAHPGYISANDVQLAAQKNVCLEITTRNGHNKANKHVAGLCKKYNTKMVLDTDTHEPEDLLTETKIKKTLRTSGLKLNEYSVMENNSFDLAKNIMKRNLK
jgi:putative hydrolase